jgi:hypothetical protein
MIIPKFSLIEPDWTDTWMSGLLILPHIILISSMIGAVILSGWIVALFESTELYMLLTLWGSMEINFNFSTFSLDTIQVYTGEYFYNFIIIIVLFFLSAWIIDNKVEV